jgi:putative tryptophan/tyrosine transport system substrate-binding protein
MRTPRRRFLQGSLAVAGLSLCSGCGLVSLPGQRPAAVRRIGYLESGINANAFEPIREGLGDLGYVEGQNIVIEYRSAEGRLERLPALAAELVDLRVELIVARDTAPALAASRATSAIPIVAAGGNVVAAGLVTNIARPEGNITGVTTNSVETVGKWVELLKETVPTISRLAVMLDLSGSSSQAFLQQVEHAARTLQVQVTTYDLRDLDQLSAVLSMVKADGAEGLLVVSGGILVAGMDPRIGGEVLRSRLPAVAEARPFAANGGLLAHGTNIDTLARRSASYVDKILKGARPSDLPLELPTTFEIVVNLKTAQELGITIPQSVLQRATQLIQ